MNITPINNVPFGIKIKTKEHLTSPISKLFSKQTNRQTY